MEWPFKIEIDGDDIVVKDVIITCFGGWGTGIDDPQDNGETASGLNTKTQVVYGVSVPMNGLDFHGLSAREHHALDYSPIPRLRNSKGLTAWHTPVVVTITSGNRPIDYRPKDGIVDLGPGLQASKPGEPHALDLTVLAASVISPVYSFKRLSREFEVRGSYRIIGGAKLGGLI